MSRAPNLTEADIGTVVGVLDGWMGKLTWARLISALEARLLVTYTRQALHNHARIAEAFALRKKALSGATPKEMPRNASPELQAALGRIERLAAENTRLTAENEGLLVQFAIWLYNAESRGLTKEQLNASLPVAHRESTVLGRPDGRSRRIQSSGRVSTC